MVTQIFLYPVKGLTGLGVEAARVQASGSLEFDRRWAMVDGRERFVNGKNFPELHRVEASFDLAAREMALDGRVFALEREGSKIAAWFSERLGERVEWREDAVQGFPDDTDSPGPTFVSAATVARVGAWFGLTTGEVQRRFRYNVIFDGVEAFGEDRLYGTRFRAGDITVEAVNPCQRCVVPSQDSRTGVQDAGFQRRFAELREAELPVTARRDLFTHFYRLTVNTRIPASEAGKTLRVGDEVRWE